MYFNTRPFVRAGLTVSQIRQIESTINAWIQSCGLEWTVNRLKSMKLIYINRLAGRVVNIPWLSVDRNGTPKGPFRPLFLVKGKSRKCFDALMCYTGITFTKVTKSQRDKFEQSVRAEPLSGPWFIPCYREACEELLTYSPNLRWKRLSYHHMTYGGRSSVGLRGKSALNEPERFADDFTTKVMWDFLDDDACQQVIADSLDDLYPVLFQQCTEDNEEDWVGKVSVIQERGGKARFIAIPRLTFQMALNSLGRYLLEVCRGVPWDCTHDQEAGARWAQEQLQNGKRLWSVDLSDFTNHWPLAIIIQMLRWFDEVPYQDIRLFYGVSTGPYRYTPKGPCRDRDQQSIRWTRGQPLGMIPSFPAAALSHGAMLRSLELTYGVNDSFRVLGDDVIISNPLIHWGYRRLLDKLNIPVSLPKTLANANIGEFGGFIIQKNSVWRPRKTIIPNPANWLTRKMMAIEDGHYDIKKPRDLAALVLQEISGQNRNSVPLALRAALSLLMFDEEGEYLKKFKSVSRKDKSTYWRLVYYTYEPLTEVGSRSELQSALTDTVNRWNEVNTSLKTLLSTATVDVPKFLDQTNQFVFGWDWYLPKDLLVPKDTSLPSACNYVDGISDEIALAMRKLKSWELEQPWWKIVSKMERQQLTIVKSGLQLIKDRIETLTNELICKDD